MLEINPITHPGSQVVPLIFIHHYRFAALLVIIFDGYLFADIIFGNTELFFNLQLHRKSVCIPASFAFYLETLQRFVTAEDIFYSAGHYVVNARCAIGRWRPFVEREGRRTFAKGHRFFKNLLSLPEIKDFICDAGKT